jgi:hypothetical protein
MGVEVSSMSQRKLYGSVRVYLHTVSSMLQRKLYGSVRVCLHMCVFACMSAFVSLQLNSVLVQTSSLSTTSHDNNIVQSFMDPHGP